MGSTREGLVMKYMLDTDTCIYLIRKKTDSALEKVKAAINDGIAISAITLAELECGVNKSDNPERNANALYQILASINVLPFDFDAAHEYGVIRANLEREGNVIGNMDMLIAAHAKSKGCIIVTNNIGEFKRVKGLTVENWV